MFYLQFTFNFSSFGWISVSLPVDHNFIYIQRIMPNKSSNKENWFRIKIYAQFDSIDTVRGVKSGQIRLLEVHRLENQNQDV